MRALTGRPSNVMVVSSSAAVTPGLFTRMGEAPVCWAVERRPGKLLDARKVLDALPA